jgi:predicted RNA polymerase sigma factor
MVRDVGLAEDLAQDALVAALEHWPRDGIPDIPGAWLMTTAKHRALDRLRRNRVLSDKLEQIGHDMEVQEALVVPDFVDGLDAARADEVGDDLLRLIFTACHPVLSTDARVALTLKPAGRPDHTRNCPRLPGARGHHGPAHRACQAHPDRSPRAV